MLKVLHDLESVQYYVLSKPSFHRSPHQRLHLILWLGPRWLLLPSIQLRHAQHQEGSFTLHNKWFLLSSDYILNNSWCSHDPTIFSDLFSNVKTHGGLMENGKEPKWTVFLIWMIAEKNMKWCGRSIPRLGGKFCLIYPSRSWICFKKKLNFRKWLLFENLICTKNL